MKAGMTLKTRGGIQVALFPLENLRVTQGIKGELPDGGTFYSHKNKLWMDFNTLGFWDKVYAPCDVVLVAKQLDHHGVTFKSVEPVQCANGEIRHIRLALKHDGDISDLEYKKTYKQGEKIYDEGTVGRGGVSKVYPSHVHMEVYDAVTGIPLSPFDVFYVNGTNMLEPMHYKWRTYVEPSIIVGDIVRVVGLTYPSGKKIPLWVRKVKHKVMQVKPDRVLLGGYMYNIKSWVYLKDVQKW